MPAGDPRACRLCGTALVGAAGEQGEFCCAGCQRVHEVLGQLDEGARGAYLEAARRLGVVPDEGGERPSTPAAEQLPPDPAARRAERFNCSGLMCPSCAWVAEQVLASLDGVERAEVSFFSGQAQLAYDLRRTSAGEIREVLARLGYGLEPPRDATRSAISRRTTLEFLVVAVITANLMMLSSLRYFEGSSWLDQVPAFLHWVELLLAVPVLYVGWVPAARRAVAGVLARRPTMDLLIATGVAAAFALSTAALIAGRDDIFFETAAGLVTISLLSRMIEARLRERAFAGIARLLGMRVANVRLPRDEGTEGYAPLDEIRPGQRVAFEAGDTVPFDGELVGAPAAVSEAVLTGEPAPIPKVAGDRVVAGSAVVDGRLEMVVLRGHRETRLAEISASLMGSLQRAEGRLRLADRISAVFVPAVLAVALAVWLARWLMFGAAHALSPDGWFPSVAVLAVACPCAFSLAGITAITAVTGNLLRRGFLVAESAQLEGLHRVERVIFDKTGTLTTARMRVEQLVWRDAPRPELLPLVLAAERGSRHPVATAIRAHLAEGVADATGMETAIEDLAGVGRRARQGDRELELGSAAVFDDRFDPPGIEERHTVVWFGEHGRAAGCFLMADTVRPDAAEVTAALRGMGLRLELVSGVRAPVAERVAGPLGIDAATGDAGIDDK
ncbi:MAG: cation-translocating P-type ATPase, partial [Deltaproteobacteria bacterium]|nr:cation-translocating P-type ATPase [Deltaproteobacteria bacterium]